MNKLAKLLVLFSIIILNSSISLAQYVANDTLKITFNLLSGYYSNIDWIKAFIYQDPVSAIQNSEYIAEKSLDLIAGSDGDIDTLYYSFWVIPDSIQYGEYFLTLQWSYNSVTYASTKTFTVGPLFTVEADSLRGYGYIDQNSVDSNGQTLGPVYLPGDIPAEGAKVLVYYHGTNALAGTGLVDGAGHYKVWVSSAGTYDVQIEYPGYVSGKRTGISPTVPD